MALDDKAVNLRDLKVSHDDLDGKVTDLKSDLNERLKQIAGDEALALTWEQGNIDVNGQDAESQSRIRTNYVDVADKKYLVYQISNAFRCVIHLYDADKNHIRYYGWFTNKTGSINLSEVSFVRFQFSKLGDSLTPYATSSDAESNFFVYCGEISLEYFTSVNEDISELKTDIEYTQETFNGKGFLPITKFKIGNINIAETIPSFSTTNKKRICTPSRIVTDRRLTITPEDGYRFYIIYVNENNAVTGTSGWHTTTQTISKGAGIMLILGLVTETADVVNIWDVLKHFSVNTFMTDMHDTAYSAESEVAKLSYGTALKNIYWDHLFIDKITSSEVSNTIIPNQSLANIETARRLGFTMIEGNTKETATVGGYIMLHGDNGKFGYEVVDKNGTDIHDVLINSKTLEWIKDNVRYVSCYEKYRVAPPTLEEFLIACKVNKLVPIVGCPTEEVVSIAEQIMGSSEYIAYFGSNGFNAHKTTKAPIMQARSLTTKAEILNLCKSYGAPYIYCLSNPDSFTDEDLADIVKTLHENGFLVAYAPCYLTPTSNQRAVNLGFDCGASGHYVNNFENGNLATLCGDISFDDFETDGIVNNDGTVTLGLNQYIRPSTELARQFLSKAALYVTYNGSIKVNMGEKLTSTFGYSSNSNVMSRWFSTYFIDAIPTFEIVGNASETVITSLKFCASKV